VADVAYVEHGVIAADIARVYAYRLDFANLPAYNPSVSNMRQVAGDAPGVGAEYRFDLTLGGATIETPLRVVEATPHERIVIDVGPAYMARETCVLSERDAGTAIEFSTVVSFPGEIDAAAADAVRAQGSEQVRIEIELMKKNLEG